MAALYHTILTIHILSFILFIGTTVIDFLLYRQFWKFYGNDIAKAKTIWEVKNKIGPIIRFGGFLAFLAGITLMATAHYGGQTWLRIKVPLVILALINAVILARKQRKAIGANAEINIAFKAQKPKELKNRFTFFYFIQLCIFFFIILLSAFRFN